MPPSSPLPPDENSDAIWEDDSQPAAPVSPAPQARPGAAVPPPASVPPPAGGPPPVKAESAASRIKWGVIGNEDEWGRFAASGFKTGVKRTVAANVQYAAPPLAVVWQPVQNQSQVFFMPWPGKPPGAATLAEFADDLRSRRPKAGDPRLARLDALAARLLDLTAELHRGRCGPGLLQPGNVMVGTAPDEVVLPDVGFFHTGGLFSPPWLTPAEDVRRLWDDPPERQQWRGVPGGKDKGDPFDPKSDLRLLARLFQWLLVGVFRRDILTSSDHPEAVGKLWGVLAAAGAGDFASAGAFKAALAEHPLSHHFAPPPAEVPRPKPTRWVAGAGVLAVLLAAIFLAWKLDVWPFASQVSLTGPLEVARRQWPQADSKARAEMVLDLYNGVPPGRQLAPGDEQGRAELRRQFLKDDWTPRYQSALELWDDGPKRKAAFEEFKRLRDDLLKLAAHPDPSAGDLQERESRCELMLRLVWRDLLRQPWQD